MRPDRKLNPDQVRYVRTSLKSSVQLADELPVDRKAIDRIRHRQTYKDVPDATQGGGILPPPCVATTTWWATALS